LTVDCKLSTTPTGIIYFLEFPNRLSDANMQSIQNLKSEIT